MALTNEFSWQRDSYCSEFPGIEFFPQESNTRAVKVAKNICKECPVKEQCLDYALTTRQPDGIWGGFTTTERKRVGPFRSLGPVIAKVPVVIQPVFVFTTAKSFSFRVPPGN